MTGADETTMDRYSSEEWEKLTTTIDTARAQDWSGKAADKTAALDYSDAGVDLMVRTLQQDSILRENRIRLLIEEGAFTVHQAAAIHDVIRAVCADMAAEASER